MSSTNPEKKVLNMQISYDFRCQTCEKQVPVPEDNDWLMCCGHAMQMIPMKQFVSVEVA